MMTSPKQQSVASLPEDQQEAAMDECEAASERYPSVQVGECSLHVCQIEGDWQVWLNTEAADFTGLCVSVGRTRDQALAHAVAVFEAAAAELQKPVV